ncbi:MAG: hypothetical protein Q8904_08985 [Bacteroidota bacterium]|nr:hypothetical protein [Bacteroidota bacterium]
MQIIHLRNKTIDYNRWDNCIAQSYNHLTYAYSWYLDIVSPDWEALVSENYEYIMPLPVKSRYGLPYLVQPVLTQQLGIFSKNNIDESVVDEFIKQIPYFSYELNLNENNFSAKALIFPNFILNLSSPYDQLNAGFSKNTRRNIDKASKLNLSIHPDLTVQTFISFYFSVDKHFLSPQQPLLEKLIEKGISEKALTLYGVASEKGKLMAGLCILHSAHRITYLLPVSNQEGKVSSAMFLLIDYLIRKNAGKDKLLDFEGSRIEGVARLYRGFGAKYHPYYILKRFRPSFLIRK